MLLKEKSISWMALWLLLKNYLKQRMRFTMRQKKAVTSAINVVTENADNLKTWLNSKKNTASDTPSEEQIQKDEEVS